MKLFKVPFTAALLACAFSNASAQLSDELPGRESKTVSKTVIFNVTDTDSNTGLFRAAVTCEWGRRKVRRMTDSTGTATISLKMRSVPHGSRSLDCIVHKRGFSPEHKAVNMRKIKSPTMVKVSLKQT